MWEERFATQDYVFGTTPAAFLHDIRHHLTQGASALSVAEGEGRNAVFLAQCGLDVTALEFAPSALAKARKLADARGVTVDFQQVDVLDHEWPATYDLVFGIFIQFVGPADRVRLFDGMKRSTRPGGLILLHGYTPKQLDYGTGGPRTVENLYTEDLLRTAFNGWDILECLSHERVLSEGKGHAGMSALIDFVARKPG